MELREAVPFRQGAGTKADGVGGVGRGKWVMTEQTQISTGSEEVQRGMEREDRDKTGAGSGEGPERREVTRADLYWSPQTASLSALTGHTVNSQPLPSVCGRLCVRGPECVSMWGWVYYFPDVVWWRFSIWQAPSGYFLSQLPSKLHCI